MAEISIVMPVYNAEKFVERAINSIIKQSYKEWKLIIVDDGSTDGTVSIIEKYEKDYVNIKVLYKKNGGSASARNYGLEVVDTKYVVFMDADDYVHMQFLETLYIVAEKRNADIVQCEFEITKEWSRELLEQKIDDGIQFSNVDFLEKFCNKQTYLKVAVLWNKIYKSNIFEGIRFPEGKGIDDEYVICQLISKANIIVGVSNVLYYYYMSPNSQMRSAPTLKTLDRVEAIEGQLELFEEMMLPHLYNMLLYRYYSCVSGCCNTLKKHFPDQTEVLQKMEDKKKGWKRALRVREISLKDKFLLAFRICFPDIFRILHKAVKR